MGNSCECRLAFWCLVRRSTAYQGRTCTFHSLVANSNSTRHIYKLASFLNQRATILVANCDVSTTYALNTHVLLCIHNTSILHQIFLIEVECDIACEMLWSSSRSRPNLLHLGRCNNHRHDYLQTESNHYSFVSGKNDC